MTVNHGVLGSSPCSGADTRGLRIESSASRARPPKGRTVPSRPQEKIRAKICRIENFAYLCNAQAIFRELSSVGSERLPYKQRVGGSNPSAPTPEAFHESERLFSYIHLPSFRLYPPPSQISHQRPGHVKHQGSKRALFSKIHIAHPKRREKHLFGVHKQNTIAKDIQRDNGGWGQGNKKPPLIAEVSELGYQDSNLE